jgi:hypothetical protein
MNSEPMLDMERRLQRMADELSQAQSELRRLQQGQRRAAKLSLMFRVGSLAVASVLVGGVWIARNTVQAAEPSAVVTRLQAPVLIQDKAGHTIAEISDRPGHHGLSLYSATGETAFIGSDKQHQGMLVLENSPGKLSTEMGSDGFKFFSSGGQSVAFVGGDDTGAGAIQLKNATGGVLVDIGALAGKTGFAQVYPRSGRAPMPVPDYLMGAKAK